MPLDTQRARIGWRCRTEALASVHAQTILGPPEIQREPHFRSGGKRTVCGLARPEGEGRLADRSCGALSPCRPSRWLREVWAKATRMLSPDMPAKMAATGERSIPGSSTTTHNRCSFSAFFPAPRRRLPHASRDGVAASARRSKCGLGARIKPGQCRDERATPTTP